MSMQPKVDFDHDGFEEEFRASFQRQNKSQGNLNGRKSGAQTS